MATDSHTPSTRVYAAALALALSVGAMSCAATIPFSPEARTARHLAALGDDPSLQADFLREMPKGGDLHLHLSGAVYAESYLRWAQEDGLCVRRAPLGLSVDCDASHGDSPITEALHADQNLYGQLIDALSMRGYDPSGPPGYTHFFDTFSRFDARRTRNGDALAEVRSRLARQNTWYAEVMQSFGVASVARAAASVPWNANLALTAEAIDAQPLREWVSRARQQLDEEEHRAREVLRCDRADRDPGCDVTIRYIVSMFRTMSPSEVLAQTLAATALVETDPRVVAINLVAPEHHPLSLRHYHDHMRAVGYVTRQGTRIAVSLHAGELTPSLVPPEDTAFHVFEAVTIAGARRIGHGSDIAWEHNAAETLAVMARRGVAIEHCLTSAAVILGLDGRNYPFGLYRRAGVAQVLATDDEGVARSDLTREYLRALRTWNLGYRDLKALAREALERSFLRGESLWSGRTGHFRRECSATLDARECVTALGQSERAREQLRLERAFRHFESHW